jgi:predicted dehydrogenase
LIVPKRQVKIRKILVVGLGSMGRRHCTNLKALDATIEVAVWRQHTKVADLQGLESVVDHVFFSEDEILAWQPDAAFVTNPAPLHIKTAILLSRNNVHLFIEKPLSDQLAGIDELQKSCASRGLRLMVGYVLRFLESLQLVRTALYRGEIGKPLSLRIEVGQYLPDWRPSMDYRQSVSAQKKLGGGAVLELSHELDYARWLMGDVESVHASVRKQSELDIDVEDMVEAVIEFKSGVVGSIHLDMYQKPATRYCRIVGSEGTLTWDGLSDEVHIYPGSSVVERIEVHPAKKGSVIDAYMDELKHFLSCVERGEEPSVGIEDGRKTVELALAIKQSAAEHRIVVL